MYIWEILGMGFIALKTNIESKARKEIRQLMRVGCLDDWSEFQVELLCQAWYFEQF